MTHDRQLCHAASRVASYDSPVPHAPTALIIGCGYLGRVLARSLLGDGYTVFGTTRGRHTQQLAELGVRPLIVSVTQPVTYAALTPALDAPHLEVFYLVPPGKPTDHPTPRQTVLGGVAHMAKQLRRADVRRAVLASSTAVYGYRDGRTVDADTPPLAVNERASLLLEGEGLWRDAGERFRVVRLAGLYGPGRVIGLNAVKAGHPIAGNPNALLNLIHVDDAAALLRAVAGSDEAGGVELGCDGHPPPRRDYYGYLAELLGASPPMVLDAQTAAAMGIDVSRLSRASSKALDHIVTSRRTGWAPRYSSYRQGVPAAIAASRI